MVNSQLLQSTEQYEEFMSVLDNSTDYSNVTLIHGNEEANTQGIAPTSYPCICVVTDFMLEEKAIQVISFAYPKYIP